MQRAYKSRPQAGSRGQRHILVLGAYVALTLLMTAPLLAFFSNHVVGTGGDVWQTLWRFEEKGALLQAAAHGADDVDARQELMSEFLGRGEPRLVNLSVWPWVWAQLLFGQPVAYNLVWLLSFVLAGYSMYLLGRYLLGASSKLAINSSSVLLAEAPAFLAGVAYMFLPYRIAHAQGHFGAMQTGWLPFIILASILFFRRPTLIRAAILAVLVAVQAWTEHHYLLWLAVLGVLAAGFFWRELAVFWRRRAALVSTIVLAALLFFLVVLPYRPTIHLALSGENPLALGEAQTIRFSADPFAYITPAPFHPIWGATANFFFARHFTGNRFEATNFLGLLPLLLVIFFWRSVPERQRLFWATVTAIFMGLSFGPQLHLLGRITGLPLPYAFLNELPVFSSVRAVARAGAMVGLAWMLLLTWVLRQQLHRTGAALAVLGIILLEFLFFPVPLSSAKLSSVYDEVAAMPGAALIELPAATNYTAASKALLASRVHGKFVIGNIALERATTVEEFVQARSLPVLRQLLFLRTTHLLEDRPDFFAQEASETLPDVLRWVDARTIVVHQDSLTATQQAAVEHLLEDTLGFVPVLVGDAQLYRLPELRGGDGVFLARDENWTVTFDRESGTTFAGPSDTAGVTLYNVRRQLKTAALIFRLAPKSEGSLLVRRGDEVLFDQSGWSGDDIRISLELAPGATELTFQNRLPGPIVIQDPQLGVQ
jgi:hypothetical protein